MNKLLIALYVACIVFSTAYIFSRPGTNSAGAPVLVADRSIEPT